MTFFPVWRKEKEHVRGNNDMWLCDYEFSGIPNKVHVDRRTTTSWFLITSLYISQEFFTGGNGLFLLHYWSQTELAH